MYHQMVENLNLNLQINEIHNYNIYIHLTFHAHMYTWFIGTFVSIRTYDQGQIKYANACDQITHMCTYMHKYTYVYTHESTDIHSIMY